MKPPLGGSAVAPIETTKYRLDMSSARHYVELQRSKRIVGFARKAHFVKFLIGQIGQVESEDIIVCNSNIEYVRFFKGA